MAPDKANERAPQPVLIDGQWRPAEFSGCFQAENPQTRQLLPPAFPVSTWADCEAMIQAAGHAAEALRQMPPGRLGEFLECYANRIDARSEPLVARAHQETALAKSPRLADVELPRTTSQLRQAAKAAVDGSWTLTTIDSKPNIRSWFAPLGPIVVFGPNNFPLAFGSISGGDFAAAVAAGNPVIAKANSSHPGTTQLLAEEAQLAARETGMPPGTVQMVYRLSHEDGKRLVADPRIGGTGYTGSRSAGLELKESADRAGKPIYLELSSVNPVLVLPGALDEASTQIAEQFTSSCLLGSGQFCTNPGLVLLLKSPASEAFATDVAERFATAPAGTLLSPGVESALEESISALVQAGARATVGHSRCDESRRCYANTLLQLTGDQFLADPLTFQTEAFGNAALFVFARDVDQLCELVRHLEGNLTGCVYSAQDGRDEPVYERVAPLLRQRVGRLLNDKMPTGVAVSPAMNHGGPYPATGHPGFTAVGIPAALRRFAMLHCYDNVRSERLPWGLRDENPTGTMWRFVDGRWTLGDVPGRGGGG